MLVHTICHSDDRREEESRMHKVVVTEILRFALNDNKHYRISPLRMASITLLGGRSAKSSRFMKSM